MNKMNVKKLAKNIKNERNLDIDPTPLLKKAMTVGMLKKELENLDENMLVELNLNEKLNADNSMSFSSGFILDTHIYGDGDFDILNLNGSTFDGYQDYLKFNNEVENG